MSSSSLGSPEMSVWEVQDSRMSGSPSGKSRGKSGQDVQFRKSEMSTFEVQDVQLEVPASEVRDSEMSSLEVGSPRCPEVRPGVGKSQ